LKKIINLYGSPIPELIHSMRPIRFTAFVIMVLNQIY
jgi:hypothetical protein